MLPNEHLDLSRIPDADAEEILKIAKQEARRALRRGADPTLKDHLESEGVLAACTAYCTWPGGKSILAYARSAAKNKITDELRSESNSDAIRGYAADVLNLSRRGYLHLASSEDGAKTVTDSIDAFKVREARLNQNVPIDFPGMHACEVTDTITFGNGEYLPAEITAVVQGYSYDAAAVHVDLLSFFEAHLPSLNPTKRKQVLKRIENAFLRYREKMQQAKATARKPADEGPEPQYWRHVPPPGSRAPGCAWPAEGLPAGNRKLGAKPLHDLFNNPKFAAMLDSCAEIAYQAWCEAMLYKGFSGVDCVREIQSGDRNPRRVFQEHQRRNRLIVSARRSREFDKLTHWNFGPEKSRERRLGWDAWVQDGRKDLTTAPVVRADGLTPGQVFDIIEPAAKQPKRAVA
jgi:hypothetical protein